MIRPGRALPADEDRAAVAELRAHGYRVADVQSLARDQQPFAVRIPAQDRETAPGVRFRARTVELGDGCFTNAYTLDLDLDRVRTEVVSAADGFHLRDLLSQDGALAAVSGSFSFISDVPSYQPAEPCLDFCCRDGRIVSLPTAAKPAFLVHRGRPVVTTLAATGELAVDGHTRRWVGSKTPRPGAAPRDTLTVYGAANCRVGYADDPRTGFVRHVDRATNTTPADPCAVDHVVSWVPGEGHRITEVHPGGGAGLFAGAFVLRADRRSAGRLREGAEVRVARIAGLDAERIACGISLGPSVSDAVAGRLDGYDESLGASPFRDTRHARTLIGLHGRQLRFLVLDGAPLAETFRGVTPAETAELCAAEGLDPRTVHHLDGGQSSKIAFTERGRTHVVGSMHYLQWPSGPEEPFRWRGPEGRVLRSGFAVRAR